MFGLNPWLAGVAFVAGIVAASVGYEKFIIPDRESAIEVRVTKIQQIICRDTTNLAAAAAQEAARLRQLKAGEAALEALRATASAREAAHMFEIETLELENSRYARQLVSEGRSCPLDRSDIDWLRPTTGTFDNER